MLLCWCVGDLELMAAIVWSVGDLELMGAIVFLELMDAGVLVCWCVDFSSISVYKWLVCFLSMWLDKKLW